MKLVVLNREKVEQQKAALKKYSEQGDTIFGFEATLPNEMRKFVRFNFNSQHEKGFYSGSCVTEVQINCQTGFFPVEGDFVAVLTRPDADSLAGVALMDMFWTGGSSQFYACQERINTIHNADVFASSSTPWQPMPMFYSGFTSHEVGPVALLCDDPQLEIERKIKLLKSWLRGSPVPHRYKMQHIQRCLNFQSDLERGIIRSDLQGKICRVAVPGKYGRQASSIGYQKSPFVIADIAGMTYGKTKPFRKVSLFAWPSTGVVLTPLYDRLNRLEQEARSRANLTSATWGGGPTAGGSPEKTDCLLSIETIQEEYQHFLLERQQVTQVISKAAHQ